jgi:hypothetical protein
MATFDTSGWSARTVFVREPDDNGNPLIGTLNLFTGQITPLATRTPTPRGCSCHPVRTPISATRVE